MIPFIISMFLPFYLCIDIFIYFNSFNNSKVCFIISPSCRCYLLVNQFSISNVTRSLLLILLIKIQASKIQLTK